LDTLVIDANVVISDPLLRGSKWAGIKEAVDAGDLHALIPQFAFDEAIAGYGRLRESTASSIKGSMRNASAGVKKHLEAALGEIDSECERYKGLLRERLAEVGIELHTAVPTVAHAELVRRAIARTRPFDSGGSGYRDCLHWFVVLDLLDDLDEEGYMTFVSADQIAFASTSKSGELHDDLRSDVQERMDDLSRFVWLRSIDEFELADEFTDDTFYADGDLDSRHVAALIMERARPTLAIEDFQLPLGADVTSVIAVEKLDILGAEGRRYRNQHGAYRIVLDLELTLLVQSEWVGGKNDGSSKVRQQTRRARVTATSDLVETSHGGYEIVDETFVAPIWKLITDHPVQLH
jgi:hypothetical protein